MKVRHGDGKTEYGPGVLIELSGDEVATAVDAYLTAHGVHVAGPRTITVNGNLCEEGQVYVDPSGRVIHKGKLLDGRGKPKYRLVSEPDGLSNYQAKIANWLGENPNLTAVQLYERLEKKYGWYDSPRRSRKIDLARMERVLEWLVEGGFAEHVEEQA